MSSSASRRRYSRDSFDRLVEDRLRNRPPPYSPDQDKPPSYEESFFDSSSIRQHSSVVSKLRFFIPVIDKTVFHFRFILLWSYRSILRNAFYIGERIEIDKILPTLFSLSWSHAILERHVTIKRLLRNFWSIDLIGVTYWISSLCIQSRSRDRRRHQQSSSTEVPQVHERSRSSPQFIEQVPSTSSSQSSPESLPSYSTTVRIVSYDNQAFSSEEQQQEQSTIDIPSISMAVYRNEVLVGEDGDDEEGVIMLHL